MVEQFSPNGDEEKSLAGPDSDSEELEDDYEQSFEPENDDPDANLQDMRDSDTYQASKRLPGELEPEDDK